MKGSKIKVITFLFVLLATCSFAFASETLGDAPDRGDLLEKREALFQKECGPIVLQDPKIVDKEALKSCELRAKNLKEDFATYEEEMYKAAQVEGSAQAGCRPSDTDNEVSSLVQAVESVTKKVKCTEKEIAEKNKDCGKKWKCNAYRSIASVTTVLPAPVKWPVNKFLKHQAKTMPAGCLDRSKPNCLSELLTSVVGNLVGSAKNLWEVAKYGAESIMNIGSWFSKKSDSMHAASNQKWESVKKFWDSPGKWFSDFFSDMKKNMTTWIMNTVYCQKWEGVPHMSKCIEAYEGFKCVGCEDSLNAICSAAGAIVSELGVAILTAGAGTITNVTTKASAYTLRMIAKKTAKKIDLKSPKLPITPGKSALAAVKASKAVRVAKLAKGKLDKFQGKLDKFLNAAKKTRAAKVAMAASNMALDLAADPLFGVKKKMARLGHNGANKLLAKAGNGKVSARAKRGLRIEARAKKGHKRADKTVVTESKHSGKRAAYNFARRKKDAARPKAQQDPTKTTSSPHDGTAKVSREQNEFRKTAKQEKTTIASDSTGGTGKHDGKHQGPGGSGDNGKPGKKDENPELSNMGLLGHIVDNTLLAGDVVMKADRTIDEAEEVAQEKKSRRSEAVMQEVQKKFGNTDIQSKEDLLKALNVQDPSKALSGAEVKEKIESMKKVYDESNREKFVEKMQKMDKNITKEDANNIFNQRQAQIESAANFVGEAGVDTEDVSVAPQATSVLPVKPAGVSASTINSITKSSDKLSDLRESTAKRRAEIDALKKQLSEGNKSPKTSSTQAGKGQDRGFRQTNGGGRQAYRSQAKGNQPSTGGSSGSFQANGGGSAPAVASGAAGVARSIASVAGSEQGQGSDNYIPSTQRKSLKIGFPDEELAAKGEDEEAGDEGEESTSDEGNSEEATEGDEEFKSSEVNVGALLSLLEDDSTQIEENVPVSINMDKLTSTNEARLNSFKEALNQFGKASKRISYKEEGNQYYIYEFENTERFKVKESTSGVELID